MTNVEDYIKKNIFGKPQLKPDEKNKFLGNFAERVAIALTVAQLKNASNIKVVEGIMKKYPDYHLYLNGKIDSYILDNYIQLSVKLGYKFTIVTQAPMRKGKRILNDSDMALVVANENKPIGRPVLL
ncbi:YueI family protein [Companilactobacillus baiquanensis]|uniref:YueI family protein n=1 Tax=Companilactobacillus baiquanensis TaxID=2486005 RepID=A0ABW1UYW6_9LACO|nr:YueI family protein [Companilactobacillus baiquanensis]